MTEERIVKIARDKSPTGRRRAGRSRKRWSDNLPKDWTETRMRRKTGNMLIYSREKEEDKREWKTL